MNWDAIGAMAELAGAGGVVASLLYLAVQTQQSTRAARVQSFHQVANSFSEISLAVVQDASLSSLMTRAQSDPGSLSPEEKARYGFFMLTMFRRAESMFFHSEEGALQRESWVGIEETLAATLGNPLAREWWSDNAFRFNATFGTYVAGLVPEEDSAGRRDHSADVERPRSSASPEAS